MKFLLLLLTITIFVARETTALPFFHGDLTDLTPVQHFVDEPGPKHKAITAGHISSYTEVSLTPYIDLISGIPVARQEAYTRIIPYRKRMQAQGGMLRSALLKGKRHRGVSSNGEMSNLGHMEFVREVREIPSSAHRKFWKIVKGFKSIPETQLLVSSSANRKFRKRVVGFRSIPEAELLGLLGSQFSIMMNGKREKTFPGNRLPIAQFLTADKRVPFQGIPRTGAPIRKFIAHNDELEEVVLFHGLPKIISAVNEGIHERIFRPLDTVLEN